MKDIKVLIIPDVHGRDFWKRPVEETLSSTDAQVVFLGDYLDPYPWEWERPDIPPAVARVKCRQDALDRFKEILDIKRKYPDRVTLLLGNHDCGYAIGSDICDCRTDHKNYQTIEYLFKDNRKLFQIASSSEIAGKRFVFSHAGLLKGWVTNVFNNLGDLDPVDLLNNAWLDESYLALDHLMEYDSYRGWDSWRFGSPVWSDIRSWTDITPEFTFGYNIVGHTQLEKDPVVLDTIACLDCRRAFYLDSYGNICDWETDEICPRRDYCEWQE